MSLFQRRRSFVPWFLVGAALCGGPLQAIRAELQSQAATLGAPLTLSATALPGATYAWQRNGRDLAGESGASLTLTDFQPANAGIYRVTIASGGTTHIEEAVIGVASAVKVAGEAHELQPDILHPTGRYYDQVLLDGPAATITADADQVTRMSYIDLNNDIVQVEFSGAGSLTVVLDDPSGPATPANYNQSVLYMKGHASIVIAGANATTNASVFTVGRATAYDPTGGFNFLHAIDSANNPANNGNGLFQGHPISSYDGLADIGFVAIASSDGHFGGVRTANAHYFAVRGRTGVFAPGVTFAGPLFVGDIRAEDAAVPTLVAKEAADVRITGGNLLQGNARAVEVDGMTNIAFAAGITSHGGDLPAQANRGRLTRAGADVTRALVADEGVAASRAQLRTNWGGDGATTTGPVRLTHTPMKLDDIGSIVPLGLMAAGHVTPIDHIYFSPVDWEKPPGTYDVYAAAAGTIVETSFRGGTGSDANVYRLVIEHSGTFYTYYDLIDVLDPAIGAQVPASVVTSFEVFHGRIPVTAGQRLGGVGHKTLDFSVVDTERPLPGLLVPAHYLREPWKIFTVDTFESYDEPLRSQLLTKNQRTASPRGGKLDHDIAGRLAGSWFKVGTNYYEGDMNPAGYWSGHLSVSPYVLDPEHIVVSLGNFNGQAQQFGVLGNTPDPTTVSEASGVVKYELIPAPNGAPPVPFYSDPQVFGTVLFQVLPEDQLKVEVFPDRRAATVSGFTAAAAIYVR